MLHLEESTGSVAYGKTNWGRDFPSALEDPAEVKNYISAFYYALSPLLKEVSDGDDARSHKSRAAVDYTPISVEPHGPTRGVRPIVAVANDSQSHLVASSI